MKQFFGFSKALWGIVFSLVVLPYMTVAPVFAQCVPTSATLYGSADDELVLFINNTEVTSGGVPVTIKFVTAPGTLPTYSIPPSLFNSGANVIAAENINTSATEVEAAWVIDVTCSSGQHAYFSNSDPGYMMYDDTSGSAPPTMDGSGNAWTSPSYSAAVSALYFTKTPVAVTNNQDPWLQQMYNPETGQLQIPSSVNNTGADNTANEVIYYRGTFNLNAVTYNPPNFSIQKIPGFSSFTVSYSSGSEPYTLVVCNSGAPVNTPVTVYDQLATSSGGYGGPYYSYNPTSSPPQYFGATNNGNGVYFNFPLGFVGNGNCVTIVGTFANIDTESGSPCSITNNAAVTFGTDIATAQAVVPVGSGCGPTNTFTNTSTPTSTFTPTFTYTPQYTYTFTNTPTVTSTPTLTGTPTNTGTSTFTFTVTNTPTATGTPTPTISSTYTGTPTNTSTATFTFTPTSTGTPTNTFTVTDTPTITATPTATLPNIDVFYVSKNVYNPSTDNPVSLFVGYTKFPGNYDLWIYNSAGEHIKTLASTYLSAPISQSYSWDGKNKYGNECATGVYLFYLVEPFDKKLKKIILIH